MFSQDAMQAVPSPPSRFLPSSTKQTLLGSSKSTPPSINVGKNKETTSGNLNLSEDADPPSTSTKQPVKLATSPYSDDYPSDGFTTADFYIDESMPSSLVDSSTKKVGELHQVIHDKSSLLEVRERELDEQRRTVEKLDTKLQKAKHNLKLLQDSVSKGALHLKCELLGVEKQMQKDKDEFNTYISSISRQLLETLEKFETKQAESNEKALSELQQEQKDERMKWEQQLDLEMHKNEDWKQLFW